MSENPKAYVIATTSNTFLSHFCCTHVFLSKVQIMKNPRRAPQCCTPVKISNVFIHMYYIFLNENLYIETIKEKTKCDYWGTTHTTSLKPSPTAIKFVVPTLFFNGYNMGTTTYNKPICLLYFWRNVLIYFVLQFVACCMCIYIIQIVKSRNNG